MGVCLCNCGCKIDVGTSARCLPCSANQRTGRPCKAVEKVTPEQAAVSLSHAVRRTAPNTYLVPSATTPNLSHVVTLMSAVAIACNCAWGNMAGPIAQDDDGTLSKRPCRHVLAVARSGARFELVPVIDLFAQVKRETEARDPKEKS